MADKPKTVTVEALKYHTNAGAAYDVGDTYDVDEAAVGSLAANGFAIRTDRVAVAKEAAKAVKAKPSQPVAPMTTTSKSGKALAKPRKAKK